MPTISMFYGILIRMFFYDTDKHSVPHIHADSAQYEGDFVAFQMPNNFRDDLQAKTDALETAIGALATAKAGQIAATAEISADLAANMRLIRALDPIVRNIYADNIGKIAAWSAASHVEKAPKATPPPAPPTP